MYLFKISEGEEKDNQAKVVFEKIMGNFSELIKETDPQI